MKKPSAQDLLREECLDESGIKRLALLVMRPPDWRRRVKSAFAKAGFEVRKLMRERHHRSVWVAHLVRRTAVLASDKSLAARQIRKAVVRGGIKIGSGEFSIIDRRGDRLTCAFVFEVVPAARCGRRVDRVFSAQEVAALRAAELDGEEV